MEKRRPIIPRRPGVVPGVARYRPVMNETYSVEPLPLLDKPGRIMESRPGKPAHLPMGDYAQTGEPHQNYWRVINHNIVMPPQKPVVQPPVDIPSDAANKMRYLARAICECLSCTMLQAKRPNWVEPPSESLMVDQTTTADGIPIPGTGAWTEVLRIIIPDRWYGILDKFGNALEDDVAFTNVDWRVQINDRSQGFTQYLGGGIVAGGIFTAQLGDPASPTKLSMPIIVKYGDVVSVQARSANPPNAHTAYARIMGWMYPIQTIDGTGEPCHPVGLIPLWTDGALGVTQPIS